VIEPGKGRSRFMVLVLWQVSAELNNR